MDDTKRSGEYSCSRSTEGLKTQLIVITGGPGAGKTALLEFVRKIYCKHVAILPEAASVLFGGGFWRMDSDSAKNSAQMAIYHVQREMENLVIGERSWLVGLCDRGTLDGLAYWKGSEQEFFDKIQTSKELEMQKYFGVIHLASPSEANGYNYQNPIRNETAKMAMKIDQKICEIWSEHPNCITIQSSNNFMDKVILAATALDNMMKNMLSGHSKRELL